MLQHHSHIGQKWLFHSEICLQNYEKRLFALSCVIRSVCLLSVCTEQLGPMEQIVMKFYTVVLFVKKIHISRVMGTLLEDQYVFMIISHLVLRMRIADKSC
jgi:hypothetical protein